MFKYNKGFTHGGTFHADDVFSTAFLKILNPNIKIERGFKVPENYDGIVYDIGDGEFDHHSKDRECRINGIMYASFGKLWRAFSYLVIDVYGAEIIDNEFISIIDECDNTSKRNILSSSIYNFNSLWNEENNPEKQYENFMFAVDIAQKILLREIEKTKSLQDGKKYVLECYAKSNNGIVILDRYVPWENALKETNTKVVIHPSSRGGYNVQRLENSGFEFPMEWWGVRDNKNVKGLLFCHPSGFMCNFDTLENTLNAINSLLVK